MLDPVKLEPAVATLSVTSNQPGTLVLVDGLQRGVAPMTIADVCEGQHLVELKSASGRYFQRIDARTGQKITVEGTLRPGVRAGLGERPGRAQHRPAADDREAVPIVAERHAVRARGRGRPPRRSAAEKLPPDWLAFDANKRPLGTAAEVADRDARRPVGAPVAAVRRAGHRVGHGAVAGEPQSPGRVAARLGQRAIRT